jgi:hypothetical protein
MVQTPPATGLRFVQIPLLILVMVMHIGISAEYMDGHARRQVIGSFHKRR